MRRGCSGFTLLEIIAASLIATIVAAGTLSAYVTAARMQQQGGGPGHAEATALSQQLLEAMRNQVAEDSMFFLPPANGGALGAGWQQGNTVVTLPAPGSSESILNRPARWCYRLDLADPACISNCLVQVQTKVCWNDLTACPCPP